MKTRVAKMLSQALTFGADLKIEVPGIPGKAQSYAFAQLQNCTDHRLGLFDVARTSTPGYDAVVLKVACCAQFAHMHTVGVRGVLSIADIYAVG